MGRTTINVYRNLMGSNEKWAERVRRLLGDNGLVMINMIGSPGSGKTTLLEASVNALRERVAFAVLEGDVATLNDAERLHRLGVRVSQLLTDGGCHLQARMVYRALEDLPLEHLDLVIVENVGNLVCPAQFDIGETAKVAVLSVTEGEDKPAKYPMLFREARVVALTKCDLVPHLPFRMDVCLEQIRRINASLPVLQVSALTGDGVGAWIGWLAGLVAEAGKSPPQPACG